MEIREFAERVLMSESLEEKLAGPEGDLTDEFSGDPICAPEVPGRPGNLVPTTRDRRNHFPGIDRIESAEDRARLLHFLANHELIAAELMALVLLKFPHAPKEFRLGILRTLLEEQHHTLWYMKRMESLGISFGSLPVNAFIWNHIRTMEEPMDFVSRLSLTFEQANLDYSRHYAMRFREAGDGVTARIFDKIYIDEIDHVQHGLLWFRRWKNHRLTDWDAWCQRLSFPLSPMRAKGTPFNIEGRQAAGLGDAFIRELEVFSMSRGRTPGIYIYNPDAEYSMGAVGPYHPPALMLDYIHDLEILPAFLSHNDDIVLTAHLPSVSHRKRLVDAGMHLPEFCLTSPDRKSVPSGSPLLSRRIGDFHPWSWSGDMVHFFRNLHLETSSISPDLDRKWNPSIRQLFSKSWSVEFLRDYSDSQAWASHRDWLVDADAIGQVVHSFEEAEKTILHLRSLGYLKLVVKLPFGSAGGNQLRLWEPRISDRHLNWIRNGLARQNALIIEPWLDRVMDFSIQIDRIAGEWRTLGWTRLINDHRGQFQSILTPFRSTLVESPEIAQFIYSGQSGQRVPEFYHELISSLGKKLDNAGFSGPLGIDAFIYKNASGDMKLKPVVEFNPRYTMGRLAYELSKSVQSGKTLLFSLMNHSRLRSLGYLSFADWDAAMQILYPMEHTPVAHPQIQSGHLSLTDPETARVVLGYIHVGTLRHCLSILDPSCNQNASVPGASE
ncbi:MAG: ferritin-like domain-containing protein [Verrucomicrobia bacterium]|nr:ferritin-like domain-containing protein [Verrucomicrobiota bacterium]